MRGEVLFLKLYHLFLIALLVLSFGCNEKSNVVKFDEKKLGRLEFSGSENIEFGEVVVNTVNDIEFEVTNPGVFDATTISFGALDPTGPFSYLGGEFPGLGGNCGATLMSGGTCKVVLRFMPTQSGNFQDLLPIRFENGVSMTTSQVVVKGKAGMLANLQPELPIYFYGALGIGDTAKKIIKVTNSGDLTANSVSMIFSPLNDFNFTGGTYPGTNGTCGLTIPGKTTCLVDVTYNSQSIGPKSSTLRMNYNNGISTAMAPAVLKAVTDIIEGRLELNNTNPSYDFGIVPKNGSDTVTISFKNVGYDKLSVGNVTLTPPFTFDPVGSTCVGRDIEINEICDLSFKFSPVTTGVLLKSGIVIDYEGGKGSKTLTLADYFQGRGLNAALLKTNMVDDVAEFSLIGVGSIQILTLVLTNIGSMDANPISITPFGSGGAISANQSSGCFAVTRINRGGQSCSINFLFQPTSVGVFSETLTMNYHNGIETVEKVITVFGRSIRKAKLELVSVNQMALDNSILSTDISNAILVKVKNVGSGTARDLSENLRSPYFYANSFGPFAGSYPGVGGDCPADRRLPPGAECTLALAVSYRGINFTYAYDFQVLYDDGIEARSLEDPLMSFNATFVFPGVLAGGVPSIHWKFPQLIGNFPVGINSDEIGIVNIQHSGNFSATLTAYSVTMTSTPLCGLDLLPTQGMILGTSTCLPLSILENGASCGFPVQFNPQCVGVYQGEVNFTYTTAAMAPATVSKIVAFRAEAKELGYLTLLPASLSFTTLVNVPATGSMVVTNSGKGNAVYNVASVINPIATPGVVAISGPGTTGNFILGPGQSETIDVAFNPPMTPKQYNVDFSFNYDNTDDFDDFDATISNDNYNKKIISGSAYMTSGYTTQIVIANNAASKHLGFAAVGGTVADAISVTNLAGLASTVNFSFTGPGAARYTSSVASCVLASSASCSVNVTFTAVAAGLISNSPANFVATYFDGVSTITKVLPLTAETRSQNVNHAGWERIKAYSDLSTSTVYLKWKPFTGLATTIYGYMIFRRLAWQNYDMNTPIATDVLTDYYEDSTAIPGTEYYYLVTPIYTGNNQAAIVGATKSYPSIPTQGFSKVQIIAPPRYMSLIHRWEANRQVCEEYLNGSYQNSSDNFSCTAYGLGSSAQKFDFGKHLFVDRYEINNGVGATYYNEPGKTPKQDFTQQGVEGAWDYCRNNSRTASMQINQNGSEVTGTRSKRLMGLLEYRLAVEFEDANDLTENSCAVTSGNLTGQRSSCVSRHEIYDLIGNGWEWLRDKMSGGAGSTGSNIESNWAQDSYLNNLSYAGLNSSYFSPQAYSLYSCFSPILGIPVPSNGASCGDHNTMPIFTDSNYRAPWDFVNNYPVPTVLQAGGPFSSTLSKFNLFWLIGDGQTPLAGARCSYTY